VLSGSELWLLRLMADRGLALLDASTLVMVVEERNELRVAAASGRVSVRVRVLPLEGSALGALYEAGKPLSLDKPRGQEATWLHELGLEVRAVLVEPFSMDGQGGGLVIAGREDGGFRDPDRRALNAFAASVAQRLAAERSVEIERLRFGMEARERERTRWAREIHDETVQGLGALRMKLATARDQTDQETLREAVDGTLEGLALEIEGLRHLITELRPAALDDLGLIPALEALARRAQPSIPPVLEHADIVLDAGRRVAFRAGRELALRPKEFGALELLLAAQGRVVSAEELLARVWDEAADPFTGAVKVTISRLRSKLGDPPVIETVARVGYRI